MQTTALGFIHIPCRFQIQSIWICALLKLEDRENTGMTGLSGSSLFIYLRVLCKALSAILDLVIGHRLSTANIVLCTENRRQGP